MSMHQQTEASKQGNIEYSATKISKEKKDEVHWDTSKTSQCNPNPNLYHIP